ncbi:MAG: hypothetical protein ABI662_01315 [Dermatophilaceae bacterium]
MKRSARATLHRTGRRALTWRPKGAGVEPVSIRALISPLRYDVVVRADFFRLIEDLRLRDVRRPEDVASVARAHQYFVWFQQVAMARFRPWVLADEDLLSQQFTERVRSSMNLWSSFRLNGFDRRYPVTLRSASGPRSADSGVVLDRPLHVGDGGHRLALILASGADELEPGMYRVDPRPLKELIDNTAVLLPAIPLSVNEYVRFIAGGFGCPEADPPVELSGVEGLRDQVRRHRPGTLPELERVLEIHRMLPAPRP